jgi:hypothetical protein
MFDQTAALLAAANCPIIFPPLLAHFLPWIFGPLD